MSGHITPQEKTKSQRFMNLIRGLMDIVEVMAEHAPEGEYLKAMDLFKELYALKPIDKKNPPPPNPTIIYMMREVIGDNPVIRQHDRRTRMMLKRRNKVLTDDQKLRQGWKVCPICDRLIARGGMSEHQAMEVCERTEESKALARQTGQNENVEYFIINTTIKAALRKVGRMSFFNKKRDSGYWLKGTYDERAAVDLP